MRHIDERDNRQSPSLKRLSTMEQNSNKSEWTYYALAGDDGETYGLIRRSGFDIERFDNFETLQWEYKSDGMKYFNGMNNDASPVTKKQADELVAGWMKARAQSIRAHRKPTVLIPAYLDSVFADIFRAIGCNTVWAATWEELRELAIQSDIDIAFEWRHGDTDFPVRDMLREIGKDVLLVMYRNWPGLTDEELHRHGYSAIIPMVPKLDELVPLMEKLVAERRASGKQE
ncbi:hypothetical protein ACFLQU_05070 [Verrucomicrobiota bacterium]